jgi:hypothetical protein
MSTPDLVVPVHAKDEERALSQYIHQRGQKLEGGIVGPLQVVPIQDRGLAAYDRLQRAANCFEESRAITARRGSANLRELPLPEP